MNRKERRAAQNRGGPALSPMAQTLAAAFHAHQAGHRNDAERLYRDVLGSEPRNHAALHLFGVLMHQSGKSDEALSLIGQAIAFAPRNPDYHYNLGMVLQAVDRQADAIAAFDKAIALRSDYAEAHFERGQSFAQIGRFAEAESAFRKVLALKPGDAATLNNLGLVLREQERGDDAAAMFERAVAAAPSFAVARMNLALSYKTRGRSDDALAAMKKAHELDPQAPQVTYNLALTLADAGQPEQALTTILGLRDPAASVELRNLAVNCLQTLPRLPSETRLRGLLTRALAERWSRTEGLAAIAGAILKSDPVIANAIARTAATGSRPVAVTELLPAGGLAAISKDRLLIAWLEAAPVADMEFERVLTGLRYALLAAARQATDDTDQPLLPLACALARQCYLNGYVWPQSDDESARARELQTAIGTALQNRQPPQSAAIAAIASYAPLHTLPFAESLGKIATTPPLAGLLIQQIGNPAIERKHQNSLPASTVPMQSQEQSVPAPRWIGMIETPQPVTIEAYLRRGFPQADLRPLDATDGLDILVPDCTTGRTALELAQRHRGAQILASDPHAIHLAYGAREAGARHLSGIAWHVIPDTSLPAIGRSYHLIDASDEAAFQKDGQARIHLLASLLRPHGVMLIGIRGDRFQDTIAAARAMARQGNFQPDIDGIRALRQTIARLPETDPARGIMLTPEFHTLEGARSLLFGEDANPVTLGTCANLLRRCGLSAIGIDVDRARGALYAKASPGDLNMADFARWQDLERTETSLAVMAYPLWVQKTGAPA